MKIIQREEIDALLPHIDLIARIEEGFVAYSEGRCVVPPVGELLFRDPPGDVHIKYGYVIGGEYYVVKIASGFYDNPRLGLPSSDGLMLLFRQRTGEPAALLVDRGQLTDVRTAVAGAIAAKHLAPPRVDRIGILGTGIQARLQLRHLRDVTPCRDVLVWGRNEEHLDAYRRDMTSEGFAVATTTDARELASQCNLIVTTTPSTSALIEGALLRPGTHVTAVGADTPGKRELDEDVLRRADVVVADSVAQCLERGELQHARDLPNVVELGRVISGASPGRTSAEQITVADLTGVAVQDLAIAASVLEAASC